MTAGDRSTVTVAVIVRDALGLHLRSAAQFARIVQTTGCRVTVEANGAEADGSSVLELAFLAVAQGATIRISAEGGGAEDALRSLVHLVSGEPSGT